MKVYAVLTPDSLVYELFKDEWSAKQLCDKLNAKRTTIGLYGVRVYDVK